MKRWGTLVVAGAVLGIFAGRHVVEHPVAQQMGEVTPTPRVTETEIELYIAVYAAMQKDHSLTIDAALPPHHRTLAEFRDIERRLQKDPRLVDRVRRELLKEAKALSTWGGATEAKPPSAPGAADEMRGSGKQ